MISSVLARLNVGTRGHHDAADAAWRSVFAAQPTQLAYVRRLACTYGFEAPLEAAFAYTPGLRDLVNLRGRAHAGLIAQDLLALGLRPSEIAHLPHCFPIAPFPTPLEALGWMYVVERATLVSGHARVVLGERLPDCKRAFTYLDTRRDANGARWVELAIVLDRIASGERERNALVAAAHAGFRCLINWNAGGEQAQVASVARVG